MCRNDTVEWRETRVRPDPNVDADDVEAAAPADRRLGVLQLVFQMQSREWDPPHKRDFALVRVLKPASRTRIPYNECEERVPGNHQLRRSTTPLDKAHIKDKLGVLWTWDATARGGVHSLPMMPHFRGDSDTYGMSMGMHENPFALDSRQRPPYKYCKCQD